MNFLAHIYLSRHSEEQMIGNFITDFIKAKKTEGLNPEILKGIEIHRAIDNFTDNHPVVMESKKRLMPRCHKYATVVVDVFYDHFLAANWTKYSNVSLADFTQNFHTLLAEYPHPLPEKVNMVLPYMKKENWLLSYADIDGINLVLGRMARRTKFESNMHTATEDLVTYYAEFEKEFCRFFPELEAHVASLMNNE